jgi:hypothetical protein
MITLNPTLTTIVLPAMTAALMGLMLLWNGQFHGPKNMAKQ